MHQLWTLSRVCAVSAAAAMIFVTGCSKNSPESKERHGEVVSAKEKPTAVGVMITPWGKTKDGKEVHLYTLTNDKGMVAKISDYGGIVTELHVPDRDGKLGDVVLGYKNVDDYIKATPYFGALIGRYGNRIAKGKFTLDGKESTLATNNGPNHLHGGKVGFDKVVWDVDKAEYNNGNTLRLTHTSPDGDEGYPGTLKATVTYTLTNDNELKIDYSATTDKKTVINLTNHSYFNLAGDGAGDILNHVMMINADHYLPVDATGIPTGELKPVKDTPFDFTTPHKIGERIEQTGGNPVGYDHCYVLKGREHGGDKSMILAARVYEPTSGRIMEVWTDQPGVQFYTGNYLNSTNIGKTGKPYAFRDGFCLETQHFPDSPNQKDFPSVVLEPGHTYRTTTVHKFTVEK
jgi:aldose 1-epimerase